MGKSAEFCPVNLLREWKASMEGEAKDRLSSLLLGSCILMWTEQVGLEDGVSGHS